MNLRRKSGVQWPVLDLNEFENVDFYIRGMFYVEGETVVGP